MHLEINDDWDDDGEHCRYWDSKATLVSIQSQDENDYVYSLFNYKNGLNAWIGGYKTSTGAWAWQDGSVFEYSNWASGEPNGAAPQSIMMYGRGGSQAGRWNDEAPRTRINGYVCAYYL